MATHYILQNLDKMRINLRKGIVFLHDRHTTQAHRSSWCNIRGTQLMMDIIRSHEINSKTSFLLPYEPPYTTCQEQIEGQRRMRQHVSHVLTLTLSNLCESIISQLLFWQIRVCYWQTIQCPFWVTMRAWVCRALISSSCIICHRCKKSRCNHSVWSEILSNDHSQRLACNDI